MWDNRDDAEAYLTGTYVRKDNELVYIRDVSDNGDEDYTIHYMHAATGDNHSCYLSDLDISPLPLGFVNARGVAKYVMRKPQRRWKHGLDNSNAVFMHCGSPHLDRFQVQGNCNGLQKAVLNDYPTLLASISNVALGGGSCAFSRSFAVKGNDLYYKAGKVGNVREDHSLNIAPEFAYLQELLQEERAHAGT
jgi:hypothetical protein